MVVVSLKSNRQSSEDKLNARVARFASSPSADLRKGTNSRPIQQKEEEDDEPERTPEMPRCKDFKSAREREQTAGGESPAARGGLKRLRLSSRSRSRLRATLERARKGKQPAANPAPPAAQAQSDAQVSLDSAPAPSPRRAILREAPKNTEAGESHVDKSLVVVQPAPIVDRPPGNFEEPPGNFDEPPRNFEERHPPMAPPQLQQPSMLQVAPLPQVAQQASYVQMPLYQPPPGYSAPPVSFSSYGHPVSYALPLVEIPRGDTGYGPLAMNRQVSASVSQSPKRKKRRKNNKPRQGKLKAKPTPEPESTLEAQDLRMSGVLGPLFKTQGFTGWERVLTDEYRRSFVSHRRNAFRAASLKEWYDQLKDHIQWNKPVTRKAADDGVDVRLPRYACWLTREGCSCRYEYGGIQFAPMKMPPWFLEITDKVSRACGLEDHPNSCNANYYENGDQSVGWHADDEALFDAKSVDSLIISLSLGQARTFELHPMDEPTKITKLVLENGDLCTMEGLLQKHYRHRVAREPDVSSPRINLTWRWIRRHQSICPVSHR